MSGFVPFDRRWNQSGHCLRIMDNFVEDAWLPGRGIFGDAFAVDVKENEREYAVEAEVPGIKNEGIHLELCGQWLVIAVRREEETGEEDYHYIHRERRYGCMRRSVYLPWADGDEVSASLDDGVLKVIVGKRVPSEQGRCIEIR